MKATRYEKQHTGLAVVIAIAQFAALDCFRLSASDAIQTAGDVLQYVLPAIAGGLTLGYRDGNGALQFQQRDVLLTRNPRQALSHLGRLGLLPPAALRMDCSS